MEFAVLERSLGKALKEADNSCSSQCDAQGTVNPTASFALFGTKERPIARNGEDRQNQNVAGGGQSFAVQDL